MSTRTKALHSTLYSSIGIYTEYLLGMVTAILIARHLGPGLFGVYSSLIWFVAMGVVIANSGVTTGIIKFIAELRGRHEEVQIRPFLAYMRRVQRWHLLWLLALGAGALYLLAVTHELAFDLGLLEGAMLAVAVGLRAPYMFNIAIAKGFEAFDATAVVSMVAAPVNLAMVAFAVLLHASIDWFLLVYMISSVVFFLVSSIRVRHLLRDMPAAQELPEALRMRVRRHLRIVSPTVIIGFFIGSGVEILFLNQFASATQAGYFKAAFQLATSTILLVPGVFSAVLLPMMTKALSEGAQTGGRRLVGATRYLTLLAAPVVAFCACFAGPAIGLLFGNAYAPAAPAFALIAMATAVSTVAQGASSFLVSADRQHLILALMIGFGVLKILLDVTLIMAFGLNGAVVAVIIVTLLNSTAYLLIAMRVAAVCMEWRRLLGIVLAAAAAAALSAPLLAAGLPHLWTLLAGGGVLGIVYLPMTLLFRCWNRDDILQLQGMHRTLLRGRPRILGWMLARAQRQAAEIAP